MRLSTETALCYLLIYAVCNTVSSCYMHADVASVHRVRSHVTEGVTRHSTTGRYEAHLWDAAAPRPKSVSSHF
jgi:hypothetical protein